jgi:hypothetical protein
MAAGAEHNVIGLILHQQITFRRRMGLVAGITIDRGANLGDVPGIHLITDWVPLDWMA